MARRGCLSGCLRSIFCAILILIAIPLYMYVESRMLLTEESSVRLVGMPEELSGLRIAFLADIHAGLYRKRDDVSDLVAKVNALRADLILLGGDYVGNGVGAHEWLYEELAGLTAPLGVFAVSGNHDLAESESGMIAGMSAAGIRLLADETVAVGGKPLYIAGADYGARHRPRLGDAIAGIPEDAVGILLSHDPRVIGALCEGGYGRYIDLSLAGHTHGGQLSFFGYWFVTDIPSLFGAPTDHSLVRGWSLQGTVTHLTTRGVGASVPLRFLSVPQIHLIILERG